MYAYRRIGLNVSFYLTDRVISQHSTLCIAWQEEMKQERIDELEDLRQKRKTA